MRQKLLDTQQNGLPRKKSDNTREKILKTAASLFRDQGYDASTLRGIAAATGIKAGSIYYHFDSKDQILDEVLDQGLRDVYDGVCAAIRSQENLSDYRARISSAAQAHLSLLLARSEFASANIRIYDQLPEEIRKRHQPLRRAYATLWDTLLKDAQQAGQLREDIKIVPLRQFLLGALNWTVEWFDIERYSTDLLSDRCAQLILDGISTKRSAKNTIKLIPATDYQPNRTEGSRKKSDRTRKEIMKAAAHLFRDQGYAASTLRDIAAAAGKKAGSIYYHFGSKIEILDEVLDQGLRDIHNGVQAVTRSLQGENDHRVIIAAAAHAHLTLILERSEFISTNIRIYSQLPEEVRKRHRPLRHAYGEFWDTLLRDAQRAGQLREDVTIVPLRQFLLGALNWTVEWMDPARYPIEDFAEGCARLLLDGICVRSK